MQPINNAVYLTDKWHYAYAQVTNRKISKDKNVNAIPIYLTVDVPQRRLSIDEDVIYTPYFAKQINESLSTIQRQSSSMKNGSGYELSFPIPSHYAYKDSLRDLGCCTHIGIIPLEHIHSVHFITGAMNEWLQAEIGTYFDEYKQWANSQGKGIMTEKQLRKLEKQIGGEIVFE